MGDIIGKAKHLKPEMIDILIYAKIMADLLSCSANDSLFKGEFGIFSDKEDKLPPSKALSPIQLFPQWDVSSAGRAPDS